MSEARLPARAPAADLPPHARERLAHMRKAHFFTSDLTVNEFLLVKQVGFDPLGLVMGSSIYRIRPTIPSDAPSGEVLGLSEALSDSRDRALTRMQEEAQALDADGIIGVRLEVNLHAWGSDIAEFVAIGTAVRHREGEHYKDQHGLPFTSDLSGQDFWTLIRSGHRPCGFVMGNCVYYVPPRAVTDSTGDSRNFELTRYTHALYDARELAIERLQAEAEELHAEGIVGVRVEEKQHSWRGAWGSFSSIVGAFRGEIIEFFVAGTAVVPMKTDAPIPAPRLVIEAGT